jgi:hypothetical protein
MKGAQRAKRGETCFSPPGFMRSAGGERGESPLGLALRPAPRPTNTFRPTFRPDSRFSKSRAAGNQHAASARVPLLRCKVALTPSIHPSAPAPLPMGRTLQGRPCLQLQQAPRRRRSKNCASAARAFSVRSALVAVARRASRGVGPRVCLASACAGGRVRGSNASVGIASQCSAAQTRRLRFLKEESKSVFRWRQRREAP